jgi:hypothetical protein
MGHFIGLVIASFAILSFSLLAAPGLNGRESGGDQRVYEAIREMMDNGRERGGGETIMVRLAIKADDLPLLEWDPEAPRQEGYRYQNRRAESLQYPFQMDLTNVRGHRQRLEVWGRDGDLLLVRRVDNQRTARMDFRILGETDRKVVSYFPKAVSPKWEELW